MVPMNFQQCGKAKLERPHLLKVIQSGKITVCFNNFQPIVLLQWPCCLCSMFMVLMCLNFATRWSMLSTIINLIHIEYSKQYYTYQSMQFELHFFTVSQFPKCIFAMYNSYGNSNLFMTAIKILHKCTFQSDKDLTQNCACMYVLCCKSVHRKESFYSICKQSHSLYLPKSCGELPLLLQ